MMSHAIALTGAQQSRFWAKVDKRGTVEHPFCWKWCGVINRKGYGNVTLPKRRCIHAGWQGVACTCVHNHSITTGPHRVAYVLVVGEVPDGLQLDHLCRNRWCCNPAHLEPVTPAENSRRAHWTLEAAHLAIRAKAEARTHCVAGHEYTLSNIIRRPGKVHSRECRACANASRRKRGGRVAS